MIDALEKLAAQEQASPSSSGPAKKTPAEAVADIMEIQKRNRLGGLKIKDLIHEVHRY